MKVELNTDSRVSMFNRPLAAYSKETCYTAVKKTALIINCLTRNIQGRISMKRHLGKGPSVGKILKSHPTATAHMSQLTTSVTAPTIVMRMLRNKMWRSQ